MFMHILLNDNNADDILFVQEPWFRQIGTKRSDVDPQCKEVWEVWQTPSGRYTPHSVRLHST